MSKILGIDLGTTNSCMAIMDSDDPIVIPNSEGLRTTPSIVAFTRNGERIVGNSAKRQSLTNPRNTIFSAKRLIGRKFSEVQSLIKNFPYKIIEGRKGDAWIECIIKGKPIKFAPEQISAIILGKLKSDAENYLGEKIQKAVITVPAYFNDAQRQATKDAGEIAGFKVDRIINEPTAASLAYGLNKKSTSKKVAVFDLGGGTYDISILEIGEGVFEVKSTNGDTKLGGDNWDELLINFIISSFINDEGIDLRKDAMALQRLKEEVEKAKIILSSSNQTEINLPFISADSSGPKHLNIKLTRSKLEKICESLYDQIRVPFNNCLKDSKISSSEIHDLILVGGMTRSPKIVDVAKELVGKNPHKGVNPDEVVAIGAAIQGGVLSGNVKDVLLLDVTPLTLGIETAGGISTPIISRNTTIPSKKSQVFSTYVDNQTAVDIRVLQGERQLASDNKLLGNFRLDGINSAPRGIPKIEVSFDINANGILNVTAKDLGTGKNQKITIEGSSGLNKDEVKKLKKEAKIHYEEDKKKKELIESKNSLENIVYQLEDQMKKLKGKIPVEKEKEIFNLVQESKNILNNQSSTIVDIKNKISKITKSLQSILSFANVNQENPTNFSKGNPQNQKDNLSKNKKKKNKKVVDADFEVVNNKKNKKK
jgi:molecular chaperone DnaK